MLDFIYNQWIEIIGASIGLIYLYYEYNASMKMWATGIVMSIFYTIVFIDAKFYAFACINIYYIIAGIYGWMKWQNNITKVNDGAKLRLTPKKYYLPISIVIVVVYALIVYILNYFGSPISFVDGFVTTLSIVAMWMLAQRMIEQWILLIILNFASIAIYFAQGLYPTSIMYLIYAVVSVLGYLNWKRIVNKSTNEQI